MKTKKAPKTRYSAAYKKAVEEIAREQVLELKAMVKGTMDAIRTKEAERRKLDEELAFLRRDIEDLKRGRIEKIKARHEKEPQLAKGSKINVPKIEQSIVPALTSGYYGYPTTVTNASGNLLANNATWVGTISETVNTQ